uniref:Uncharacterized protein n=1 Tax=viral metagenome TaxID=1070528 RepID=A0A6M3MAT3_9ZZZZ
MKKIILILILSLLSIILLAQEVKTFKEISITINAPGTATTLPVSSDIGLFRIKTTGSITISTDWNFVTSGTPTAGLSYLIDYDAVVVKGINAVSFFGKPLTTLQALNNDLVIFGFYNGSSWVVRFLQDVSVDFWIVPKDISADAVTTVKILDKNVTLAKVEDVTAANIVMGNAGNRPTITPITGDITLTDAGLVGIKPDVIVNADINTGAAIAYSKLSLTGAILNADLAGSIVASKIAPMTINRAVVSDASGYISPSAVTATEIGYVSGVSSAIQTQLNAKLTSSLLDGKMWVGDATNAPVARTIGGDIAISNTGVGAISTGVIVNADVNGSAALDATKIANGTVSNAEYQYIGGLTSDAQTQLSAKLGTTLTDGTIWVGDGTNTAVARTPTGDITISNTGVTAIGAAKIWNSNAIDNVNTYGRDIYLSFETGYVGALTFYIPNDCSLTYVMVTVTKAIEASNDATITFKNNAGTAMAGGALVAGVLTIPAGSATGVTVTSTITGNNLFAAGHKMGTTTAKVTAGGVVLVQLVFLKSDPLP